MGSSSSKSETNNDPSGQEESSTGVDFNSFKILRSIGKGSFGKVCMVEKNKDLFAMKYLNKSACIKMNFVENVNREINILRRLNHKFIVNLWYTFQDEEDFFIVVDLLLGGDLGYHLRKNVEFTTTDMKLYLLEMASVLDYLRSKSIIHRDIKPDNILLDEKGHAHLTDFNVAVRLKSQDGLATGFAGTKPYVAPEICQTKLNKLDGYSYSADWWSLAVTMFEILRHRRPFKISNSTTVEEAVNIYNEGRVSFSAEWEEPLINLFLQLFRIDATKRLCSYEELREQEFCSGANYSDVKSDFIPSNKHLNYDPMHELEEMMIESKPLHKKKHRIKKKRASQRSKDGDSTSVNEAEENMKIYSAKFITFNRKLDIEKEENKS